MRAAAFLVLAPLQVAAAQPSADAERIVLTDYSDLTAVTIGPRRVFAASAHGIIVYDFVREAWDVPLPLPPQPDRERPTALAFDAVADALWLGTDGGRLFARPSIFNQWNPVGSARDGAIYRILAAPGGDGVLVRTLTGWSRWRIESDRPEPVSEAELPERARAPDPRAPVTDPALEAARYNITLDPELRRFAIADAAAGVAPDEWWIATRGGGLVRFSATTLDVERLPYGILTTGVGAVATDGQRLWFAGDGGGRRNGVTMATRTLDAFTLLEASFDGAPAGFVSRIVAARDEIWFAASSGLYRLARPAVEGGDVTPADWRVFTTTHGLPSDQVTSVQPIEGGLFVGTLEGVARLGSDGAVSAILLPDHRVMDLTLGRDGALWIATGDGLFRLLNASTDRTAVPAHIDVPGISGLVIDVLTWGRGVIAMTPDALYEFDGSRWTGPIHAPAISVLGELYRIEVDPTGRAWIGGDRGAAVYDPRADRWDVLRVPGDVPAGPVRAIAFEPPYVWFATPAGAVRLRVLR